MATAKEYSKTWSELTAVERKQFLTDHQDGKCFVTHNNPFIQERIEQMIPFGVAEFGGALALYPQLSGGLPKVVTEEMKQKWAANTLPVLFPNDTIIEKYF